MQDGLGMVLSTYGFYQVAVSFSGQVEHSPHRNIPCPLQLVNLPGRQVPQYRPIEVRVLNSVELGCRTWVSKMKLTMSLFLLIQSALLFFTSLFIISMPVLMVLPMCVQDGVGLHITNSQQPCHEVKNLAFLLYLVWSKAKVVGLQKTYCYNNVLYDIEVLIVPSCDTYCSVYCHTSNLILTSS